MERELLDAYVREHYKMGLDEFIKEKIEKEALFDYQIADFLGVPIRVISDLRKAYGLQRSKGFSSRFERKYGKGSAASFMEMANSTESSLSGLGRRFGFSREYARQVYRNLSGRPYTGVYREKCERRRLERDSAERLSAEKLSPLIRVRKKLESMGLDACIIKKGRVRMIRSNGRDIAVKTSTGPVCIGKKKYYRISHDGRSGWSECDFVICRLTGEEKVTSFIIPRSSLPVRSVTLSPDFRLNSSKYAKFKEAWRLLKSKRHTRPASPVGKDAAIYRSGPERADAASGAIRRIIVERVSEKAADDLMAPLGVGS